MNIFVAKLDYGVTSEELGGLFEAYGSVNRASVITDKLTGRSKGFGFVEMANDDEARKAISQLDNSSVRNRNIVVKEAEPRKESAPSFQRRRDY
jgi:RNA recognition motif-containing protein